MNFSINLHSNEQFRQICAELTHFGERGHERVQITKTQLGYVPVTTTSPGWIERILRFFGYKERSLQINEVANFFFKLA